MSFLQNLDAVGEDGKPTLKGFIGDVENCEEKTFRSKPSDELFTVSVCNLISSDKKIVMPYTVYKDATKRSMVIPANVSLKSASKHGFFVESCRVEGNNEVYCQSIGGGSDYYTHTTAMKAHDYIRAEMRQAAGEIEEHPRPIIGEVYGDSCQGELRQDKTTGKMVEFINCKLKASGADLSMPYEQFKAAIQVPTHISHEEAAKAGFYVESCTTDYPKAREGFLQCATMQGDLKLVKTSAAEQSAERLNLEL
jgi:hypothetical protein